MRQVERPINTDRLVPAINKNLDFFSREQSVYNSGPVPAGTADLFSIALGKSVRIITVHSDYPGTLYLYGSAADQIANTRPQLTLLLSSAAGGVLGGVVHNLDDPVSTAIYARLINTGSGSVNFHLVFTAIQIEV